MTTTETDRKLALAIGYLPEHVQFEQGCTYVYRPDSSHKLKFNSKWDWFRFSHKSWTVIGPIAEKYSAFPAVSFRGMWWTEAHGLKRVGFGESQVPQTAIALAVIDGAGL